MKKRDVTPSFDFDAEVSSPALDSIMPARTVMADISSDNLETGKRSPSFWQEVPQALFLSWPHAQQMAYCRDRDLDSSEHADSEWDKDFYISRATMYDEEIHRDAR